MWKDALDVLIADLEIPPHERQYFEHQEDLPGITPSPLPPLFDTLTSSYSY